MAVMVYRKTAKEKIFRQSSTLMERFSSSVNNNKCSTQFQQNPHQMQVC
jgi:hypothetical protein